jgi:hypothetical protein
VAAALGLLSLVCAGAPPVEAHPLLQNRFWVVLAPDTIHLRLGVTLRELAVVNRLQPDSWGRFEPARVQEALARHGEYLLRHVNVTADGRRLEGVAVRMKPLGARGLAAPDSATYTVFAYWDLDYPTRLPDGAGVVAFEHDVLSEFEYAPGQRWDISYVVRIKYVDRGEIDSGLLRSGRPFLYPTRWDGPPARERRERAQRMQTVLEYAGQGFDHIARGYDHLLFIAALVLAATGLGQLLAVVAVFTLAHSLTLTLTVLGLVRLPAGLAEPVIAASILAVALDNALWPERARGPGRLLVAFAFGLFHGLGFAGGLLEAMRGLPPLGAGLAIAGFSVGVEIGHLCVVLPLFLAVAWGRRRLAGRSAALSLRYGSLLISFCGLYYLYLATSLPILAWGGTAR